MKRFFACSAGGLLGGVLMAGCGLSPSGTAKVDGDEYAKAVKQTESLGQEATDLIREASDGTDVEVSTVRSSICGEPYADNLRILEMGSSFYFDGTSTETKMVDSVADGLAELGWKKEKGEDGTYFFTHGITGGATVNLDIAPSPYTEEQGKSIARMSFESTCMKIPKDVAEKS